MAVGLRCHRRPLVSRRGRRTGPGTSQRWRDEPRQGVNPAPRTSCGVSAHPAPAACPTRPGALIRVRIVPGRRDEPGWRPRADEREARLVAGRGVRARLVQLRQRLHGSGPPHDPGRARRSGRQHGRGTTLCGSSPDAFEHIYGTLDATTPNIGHHGEVRMAPSRWCGRSTTASVGSGPGGSASQATTRTRQWSVHQGAGNQARGRLCRHVCCHTTIDHDRPRLTTNHADERELL